MSTHPTPSSPLPDFVLPHDPILRLDIEEMRRDQFRSEETQRHIATMLAVARGEQSPGVKKKLLGLAAPQIGIAARIIVVDIGADYINGASGNLRVYINPRIIWASVEKTPWYEGCFSTGPVCGIVSRSMSVRIVGFNEKGEPVDERHSGYPARIFLHEIDHLNGKVFVDHVILDTDLHWVEKDQFPEYRSNYAWQNWPHLCPRDRWKALQNNTPWPPPERPS